MATPSLRLLRRALPQAEITALVGPWAARVLQGNPNVDRVLTLPFPGFVRTEATRRGPAGYLRPYATLLAAALRLRRERFDLAINLRRDFWWGAFLAYLAGIPLRAGYRTEESGPFLNRRLRYHPEEHHVLRSLRLVAAATHAPSSLQAAALGFRPEFYPTPDDAREAEMLLGEPVESRRSGERAGLNPRAENTNPPSGARTNWRNGTARLSPGGGLYSQRGGSAPRVPLCLVALQPGSGGAAKLWHTEGWVNVARALSAEGATIVLTGSAGERELCQAIAEQIDGPVLNVAGRTSLGSLAAVLARCDLVIGTDNGGLHLAAAMRTPTVALFGPTNPLKFAPWGSSNRHRVVRTGVWCSPCGHVAACPLGPDLYTCMPSITPAMVMDAVRDA